MADASGTQPSAADADAALEAAFGEVMERPEFRETTPSAPAEAVQQANVGASFVPIADGLPGMRGVAEGRPPARAGSGPSRS